MKPLEETATSDKLKRWILILTTFAMNFMASFDATIFSEVDCLPFSSNNCSKITTDDVSWVTASSVVGKLVGSPLLSGLTFTNYFDFRKVFLATVWHHFLNYSASLVYFSKLPYLPIIYAGHLVGGIGKSGVFTITSAAAILWYPESQIATCIGINMLGVSVGSFLGYILPAICLKNAMYQANTSDLWNGTVFNDTEIGFKITQWDGKEEFFKISYLSFFGLSLIILITAYFILPSFPKNPASFFEMMRRKKSIHSEERRSFMHFIKETKRFFTSYTHLSIGIQFGLLYNTILIEETLIYPVVQKLVSFIPENSITFQTTVSFLMGLFAFGTAVGNIVAGRLLDHLKEYKIQSRVASALSCICVAGIFVNSYYKRSLIVICILLTLFGLFSRAGALTFLDSLHQHTHPTDAMFVASLLGFFHTGQTIVIAGVARLLLKRFGVLGALVFQSFLQLICFMLSMFVDPQRNRFDLEEKSSKEAAGIATESTLLLNNNQ